MSKDSILEKVALHSRRTKIIATLGPASNDAKTIDALLKAGVNVVRLNMSHGDHESHRALVSMVRRAAEENKQHVAIIMDLCGPKIRVGEFPEGQIQLQRGTQVTVTCREIPGDKDIIPSQYRDLYKDVQIDERIFLDDGQLELQVISVSDKDIHCQVIQGGELKDHKGMNLPDSDISAPAFTDKDKHDALLAIDTRVDFVALSFVRHAKDVQHLNEFIAQHDANIPVISKIERPEAITNIDEILECSYSIMIARGDLGIELPAEKVPLIQRDLIHLARLKHVPVIVATQMLESMITHSRPTRAEIGDVANAALLGTDAVMLSGETASGQFPIEAVQTMDRVLREIESNQWRDGSFTGDAVRDQSVKSDSIREAFAHATVALAKDLRLQAVIIPTLTGSTPRILAAHRSTSPMIGASSIAMICRQLSLHWGIIPVHVEKSDAKDWRHLCGLIQEQYAPIKSGYNVLIVAGFNADPMLNAPTLKIIRL